MKIEEIMTKEVIAVKPAQNIYEVVNLLIEHNISGLPVVNDDNNIVGVITEKDMLRIFNSAAIEGKNTVEDLMTATVEYFSPDDEVSDLCDFFMSHQYRRVPIVSNGELVGIVARRDILKLIAQ